MMRTALLVSLALILALLWFPNSSSSPRAIAAEPGPKTFALHPIGSVRKNDAGAAVVISAKYQDALLGLDGFSHVWVLWWADRNDTPKRRGVLRVHPRGNRDNPLTGVFATRSPARPNVIGMTLCKITSVDKGVVHLDKIDAFDKTPVLDLKPYLPGYDGDGKAKLPSWVKGKKKT